jgi:hypothetical protein
MFQVDCDYLHLYTMVSIVVAHYNYARFLMRSFLHELFRPRWNHAKIFLLSGTLFALTRFVNFRSLPVYVSLPFYFFNLTNAFVFGGEICNHFLLALQSHMLFFCCCNGEIPSESDDHSDAEL